jgi:hypothetical protein
MDVNSQPATHVSAAPGRLVRQTEAAAEAVVAEGIPGMASPGGAVEVHGAVAVTGEAVTGRDPDALVAQIENTREDLARTIDELANRVSPANNIRMLRERAKQELARPEVRIGAAVAGAAVVGIVILRIWSRRRR